MNRMRTLSRALILCWMLLGVKNGYLALWKPEDPQPVQIFPVRICSLPPADQILLRSGIQVENADALQALLEDYL